MVQSREQCEQDMQLLDAGEVERERAIRTSFRRLRKILEDQEKATLSTLHGVADRHRSSLKSAVSAATVAATDQTTAALS